MGWADYASLFKLRIVALLVLLAVVAAVVAHEDMPPWRVLLLLLAGGGLASAGASALNNYLDRERDRVMERTQRRPLPAGRIRDSRHIILPLGLGLIALSLPFSLRLNPWVALFTLCGAFIYVVVYTWWLKPRSPWNIVVGGLAGSCAVLAGWSTITTQVAPALLGLGLLVFLWTPAHFWSLAIAHKADYRRTRLPMLPVLIGDKGSAYYILLHTLLTVAASFFLYLFAPLGLVYLGGMLLLGGLFLGLNLRLYRSPGAERARSSYKFSGVYLLLLLLVILGDILA